MGTHLGLSPCSLRFAALLVFAAWAPGIFAATFSVGTGPNCTHSTLAAAAATAEGSAGPDTIRITRSATYAQQAVTITSTQELTITGGFADCTTAVEDGTYTTLDGSGGSHATVLTINGSAGSAIHLRKLTITGGDINDLNSILGGGVYYTGNGLLDIADSSISSNTGAYGGGINVNGTGDAAELDLGPNTTLFGNTAFYNGGGIFSNNIETAIRGDNILIDFNAATGVTIAGNTTGGYGGGIHIRACILPSIVYLGSSGVGQLGVIYNNSARYGGGIAIEGGNGCDQFKYARLSMFSIDASRLTKIQANSASIAGGGVYLSPYHDSVDGGTDTVAYFWNSSIVENVAPEAAALFLGSYTTTLMNNTYSEAHFNYGAAPTGAVACGADRNCGSISGNVSSNGRVVYGDERNVLSLYRMEVANNQGSELIRLEFVDLYHSLFFGNVSTLRLIESNRLNMAGATFAGNVIGGAHVLGINTDGFTSIDDTIIWQPGKLALHNDGSAPHVLDVLSNDISTLTGSGSARLAVGDPRFVDPAHSDFSLTAASPAVDFAPAMAGDDPDLIGHNRDVDLALVDNNYGPRDLGALERQSVQPLVLNGTFNANLNIWPEVTAGVSTWDSTQNAPGTPAGGALHVSTTGSSLSARKQCVHLPGPGTYTLNGYGKSTGTITPGSYVSLGWEYRSAGSETCGGAVTTSGKLLLATNSMWNKPATPATITVSNFAWTTDSSILVYLIVEDGPGSGVAPEAPTATLNGWFDGITLDVLSDRIFANGFD